MAGPNIFGIGTSALTTFQRAIGTTGHNIANVNTEGYSRQRVDMSQRTPQFSGTGYIGSGVEVATVERLYNEFLTQEVRNSTSNLAQLDTFEGYATQFDRLFGDSQSGMLPVLDQFFNSVQELADFPASTPVRQAVLSEAGSVVTRFDSLYERLIDTQSAIQTQVRNVVTGINTLSSEIADLNQRIVVAKGMGHEPNDLLDQRDALIRDLAKNVAVSTVEQTDGSVSVFIGNGQGLVTGNISNTLSTVSNQFDPTRLEAAFTIGGSTVNINDSLSGGILGGLRQFQDDVLDPAFNQLGQLAMGLAEEFNDQHRLGQDLQGNLGGYFFNNLTATSPTSFASSNNAGTTDVAVGVTVTDTRVLTTSDYRLDYDGTDYTVVRLSDNTTVNTTAAGAFPQTITVASEGLSLTLTGTTISANDSWLIQPTRNAANEIAVAVTETNAIAAAAPMRTLAGNSNTGTATVSAGTVNSPPPPDANLQQTVTITFDNPPTTFDVVGTGTGNPTNVAYTSGGNITCNGWTIQISGTPNAGDVFTIESNSGATGDNRNALLLADLQNQQIMQGSSATLQETYGTLVADVGVQTHAARVSREAQETLLEQNISARETIPGVNLDEEAANLLRFQQAYQAAAQVIATAGSLFDTLLGAVRR